MSKDISLSLKITQSEHSEMGLCLLHWCPGCRGPHLINVEKPNHLGAKWTWNKNAEKPTFTPSINIVGHCHYFITDGKIQFCPDSKHKLAGMTVDLPDFPEDW